LESLAAKKRGGSGVVAFFMFYGLVISKYFVSLRRFFIEKSV
jgi:hypothetical protein